jgi:hypothetical protein
LSFLKKNWNIRQENGGVFDDGHFGRYGNYYAAVLFDEIIKSGITTNINKNPNKSYIIKNVVNRIEDENLIFKNPTSWTNDI